ncbi:MaoC family dehydratase N-terminal domain-containing protein [Paralimibaculum aggregatum]|uniref:MaoC family dehydratase N-terminal domain-containing protein n=1 Tax=Paralimibaculum aggregatum TaxID=3036245 RepID=A0ABQ6LHW6_9RHOB|nr:acyl dehydratase [Limibaculum sp. NKW23]GMG82876.1 MaoC family dehydratase N-terminal domain-containing protein [Limibaculum sp. NKW23]
MAPAEGGRIEASERRVDAMDPWAAAALIATLELTRPEPGPGDPLPPLWHWMHFREAAPRAALGADGHPLPGRLFPRPAQPRRMWAGGRLTLHAPLPLGAPAEKLTTVAGIAGKAGRSGALTFVTLRHEITGAAGLAAVEEQDIVYREDPPPGSPAPAPPPARGDETARRVWSLDATALFRYSALTFNGHRIHYDADYARGVEGYPGLVVHGPLLATLLLELTGELMGPPRSFAFRATAPVFAGERFAACAREEGEGLALWIRGEDGRLAMAAEARR